MPRRLHTGRPDSRPIPDDWETGPAVVIGRTLDCRVRIGTAADGEPVWDPTLEHTVPPAGTVVYDGPASVVCIADTAHERGVVDQLVATRLYQITLPHCATELIVEEHVVDVLTSPDPDLVGERLSLVAVERGSRRFSRVLQAVLHSAKGTATATASMT